MYSFSTLAQFSTLRGAIKKDLQWPPGEENSGLFIALNEAVNNAICHGNKNDRTKKVYLSIEKLPDQIKIIIRDEGSSPITRSGNGAEDLLQESGRGLQIIDHYVDNWFFNSVNRELTMIKSKQPV